MSSIEVGEHAKIYANGVVLPTQPWKEIWDLWILGFILYSAVMVPYRICFSAPAEHYMFWMEQAVTISFIIDVCFSFNTAYMEDERWVISRPKIAIRYLQGWFWIDFPSSLPIEFIDSILEGDSASLGMLRFLRLFRLLRLLRLLKLGEYIAALEIRFDLNLTFLRICQMLLGLLFLAHLLGCFWFYVAASVGLSPEIVTWVSSYDDGSALDAPPSTQYLYAVYWALTTLTTVGYGDITPTNNPERLYSLLALLTGALVFGYMLSSISSLVAAIDRQAALNEEKMDEVKEYMRWRKLPRDLVIRLRRYYAYYYSRKTAFDEDAILGSLTPALRLEVVRHSLRDTIGKIPLFASTLDPLFLLEVFPLLKPISAARGEVILQRGDVPLDLLFLIRGKVEVISGVDGRVLYRLQQGAHFGESVLTGRRRSATYRAGSPCELLALSASDLSGLFERRPREGRIIHRAVLEEYRRKEKLRQLSLRLLLGKVANGFTASGSGAADVAALRVQLAWNAHCARLAFEHGESAWGLEDVESSSLASNIGATAIVPLSPSPPASPDPGAARGFSAGGGKHGESASPATADPLDSRLSAVEAMIRRLEAIAVPLERAVAERKDSKPDTAKSLLSPKAAASSKTTGTRRV